MVPFQLRIQFNDIQQVIEAVKSGELKRIFVVGGCDGKENKRKYFTKFTKNLPKDTIVMTLGCAKFRFNGQDFGNLGETGTLYHVSIQHVSTLYTYT